MPKTHKSKKKKKLNFNITGDDYYDYKSRYLIIIKVQKLMFVDVVDLNY